MLVCLRGFFSTSCFPESENGMLRCMLFGIHPKIVSEFWSSNLMSLIIWGSLGPRYLNTFSGTSFLFPFPAAHEPMPLLPLSLILKPPCLPSWFIRFEPLCVGLWSLLVCWKTASVGKDICYTSRNTRLFTIYMVLGPRCHTHCFEGLLFCFGFCSFQQFNPYTAHPCIPPLVQCPQFNSWNRNSTLV